MEKTYDDLKAVVDKALSIVTVLEKKATMFSKGMLILSLLDVIFGVAAVFCTSLSVVALFASATSMTAITICGRVIQLTKIQQLEKSLRTLNVISIMWFVNKYNKYYRGKKVKMTKNTILQNILATIIAVFGVGGIVVYFLPQFTNIAVEVTNIVAMCSEIISVVSGIWLAGTHDKVLTAEEIAEKQTAQLKRIAQVEAQKELDEKQKAELEALVAQKLAEKQAEQPE